MWFRANPNFALLIAQCEKAKRHITAATMTFPRSVEGLANRVHSMPHSVDRKRGVRHGVVCADVANNTPCLNDDFPTQIA